MRASPGALAAVAALLTMALAAAAPARAQDPNSGYNPGSRAEAQAPSAGAPKDDKGAKGKDAKSAATAPPKVDQKALDRGMKEAPAIQQASGAPCQISAAAFRGEGKQKDKDGKEKKIAIYETACSGALGYLLLSPEGATPQAFDCLASTGAQTNCVLPQNADPKKGLASVVTAAGKTCAVSDAKYLGTSTSSGQNFYEVACGPQGGFRLSVPKSGAPQAVDCAAVIDSPNACTLTTKAQIVASLAPLAQSAGKSCQLSDVRWMGQGTQTNDTFYEFACGAQPGFVAVVDSSGKLKQAIDCAKASTLAGGCKMTDTTVAETAEIATYTKLAAKAGYPCQVAKYRFIGTDKTNREVVELACSNRPDGALALFGDGAGASEVVDCVRADSFGQPCKLSSPTAVYAKYTEALAAKGKTTCKVSGAAWLGSTPSGEQFVEAACADGQPGWVIGLKGSGYTAQELLSCKQATGQGVPCKLPTNVAGNK